MLLINKFANLDCCFEKHSTVNFQNPETKQNVGYFMVFGTCYQLYAYVDESILHLFKRTTI